LSPSPKRKGQTVVCPVCGLELPPQLKKCPQDGVELTRAAPTDPLVGTVIGGRYEVLSVIGRGGMSVVYKARNRAVGSIVAIKTLKEDLVQDEELFARFCQEAKAVQMLIHPHIVTVHEFGVTLNGQPFIVMDFLDGRTLESVLEQEGRIPVKRLLKIAIQVCDALQNAHTHSIIHRDIKPGNIMLIETANETDFVKLFDFGFAKLLSRRGMAVQALTQHGDVLGTPLYMSPEQSKGKELDSRSDVYSLGCVMYEALTGKAPIVGENVLDTMQKHINERPATLDAARPDLYIPDALTAVIFRTLEKNREDRYQSMNDLKRDLELLNSVFTGKGLVSQSSLPGMAKLKRLPVRGYYRPTVQLAVGLLVAMVTIIGVLSYLKANHYRLPGESQVVLPPAPPGDEARVAWAHYRQEGLKAFSNGEYALSESLFNIALNEATKQADDESRAVSYLDLAHVYLKVEKLSDAEKAATKALTVRQKMRDSGQRPLADILIVLSEIDIARDDFSTAEAGLTKALTIQQHELGPTHEDVATTLSLLGRVAEAQRNYQQALKYYKQAMAIRETALGPNTKPVAETLTDCARVLKRLGRNEEAQKALQQARAIANKQS
jgi:serine/threonine protein kinase/Tfp pilus assembly protein PilF